MKPKVVVTRAIPGVALEQLKTVARVVVNPHERDLGVGELGEYLREADAAITMLSNRIDEDLLAHAPRLEIVANYAVGYNNIDLAACSARGVYVSNTPDVLTDATADLTLALLLAVVRRIPESDVFVREGRFSGWAPGLLLGTELRGKTLGIIGMGRIGAAVARRAHGFGLRIVYHNRNRVAREVERELDARRVELDELLQTSDVLSLHAPYTAAMHHLIGHEQLHLMKRTAILLNTARGALVDEKALVEALRNGTIAGAGLDVYENEPALEPGLAELPNVVLCPHTGSATLEARSAMSALAVENVRAALRGERPPTLVTHEVWET